MRALHESQYDVQKTEEWLLNYRAAPPLSDVLSCHTNIIPTVQWRYRNDQRPSTQQDWDALPELTKEDYLSCPLQPVHDVVVEEF